MGDTRVEPTLPSGFRDTAPEVMILKRHILTILISIFERYGFEPFGSATVQFLNVLFGADEWTDMSFFKALNTRRRAGGGRADTGLKFDQTVPLGRFVAEHFQELPRPFLRWEVGDAFRGERPSETRFCQFTQCDVDVVFAPGMISDAQIIALMDECMRVMRVNTHCILLNNRKILDGLPERIDFPKQDLSKVLGVLDSKDKLEEGHTLEGDLLALKTDDEAKLLDASQVAEILRFIDVRGTSLIRLAQIKAFMGENQIAQQGCSELEEILRYLDLFGVDPSRISIEPSMVRGLGYYTGPIFETVLTDSLETGSVFSGGRYDNLVERFVEMPAPATGAAFGIDRFLVYAQQKRLFTLPKTVSRVLVAYRPTEGCLQRAIQVAQAIRAMGENTVLYDGADLGLRPQIGRAKMLGIPWVVIIGEAELASGQVTLKDMNRPGWQESMGLARLGSLIR